MGKFKMVKVVKMVELKEDETPTPENGSVRYKLIRKVFTIKRPLVDMAMPKMTIPGYSLWMKTESIGVGR